MTVSKDWDKNRENERLIGEKKSDDSRSCRRQILASFIASLMSLSCGTVIGAWTPTANRYWPNSGLVQWTPEQESWIISIYVIGALIGALPAGNLSQKYGRKKFLLWLALPMTFGWIVCMLFVSNLWLECFGRLVCGLSLGATTVAVPLYASDVSSDALRGRAGVFLDFMLCAGILYGYVARSVLYGIRSFCAACALVPVVFAVLFSHMPESPAHLYASGRRELAAAELRCLRGIDFNVQNEFNRMERSQRKNKEYLASDEKNSAKNKKFLLKVWIVSLSLVFIQRLSGAGGVVQYTVVLFKLSGSTVNPNTACIIVGIFQLAASGVAFFLIDRVGRKKLLLISSAVVTASLICLIVYFSLLSGDTLDGSPWKISLLYVLCTFVTAFRLGLGPIPWFMVTELVPAEDGGLVQSVVASFSWSLSFVITKTFEGLVETRPTLLWSTFAVVSAAGLVFIALYVPETINKSREQTRNDMTEKTVARI